MLFSKPVLTSEERLIKILRSVQEDLNVTDKAEASWKVLHVNLEENYHPKVGDYGSVDKEGKFVREGNIFNKDGTVILLTPSFHGLQVDEDFVGAAQHLYGNYSKGLTKLKKKGIREVYISDKMACLAKKVSNGNGDEPLPQSSMLRHFIPEVNENPAIEKVMELQLPRDTLVLRDLGALQKSVMHHPPPDKLYSVYFRKSSKHKSAAAIFLYGRKREYMHVKLWNQLRNVRPDLRGMVVITNTTSCDGYFVFETERHVVTGVDIHIKPEETNLDNPAEKWRKLLIGGDGLRHARIWSTMPSGPSNEKNTNRRKTIYFETKKI